jgi:L-ribulose-5-phosphate 3-epimerase UlaE
LCPTAIIHELNYNSPLIICEKNVQQLFRKNVYLVQEHSGSAFQNVALKYGYGCVNLHSVNLRNILPLIMKNPSKNLIICYYKQTEEKMISDDLYWIEKNIGSIKYLAIWQP